MEPMSKLTLLLEEALAVVRTVTHNWWQSDWVPDWIS
jgi:hypothetical protein